MLQEAFEVLLGVERGDAWDRLQQFVDAHPAFALPPGSPHADYAQVFIGACARQQKLETELVERSRWALDLDAQLAAAELSLALQKPREELEEMSIAAGIPTEALQRWLGGELAVVRVMPNTPALVGSGATAISPGEHATPEAVAKLRDYLD